MLQYPLVRLRPGGLRPIAALGHKLIELGFVLGEAQTIEELAEFALLFLKPPQRVGAIFVEGAVAARGRVTPRIAAPRITAFRIAAHFRAHPVHLALQALHLVLPAVMPAAVGLILVMSATHSSAPYCEDKDRETRGPPHHETKDDQRDPGRFADFVKLRGDSHYGPRV